MDKEKNRTRYYRALLRNVVLTILFTAMTPTVVVSLFILDEFQTSYEKRVYDHLELLARKHKKSIDSFLEEKMMDIRMMAGSNSFDELSNERTLNRKFVEMQRAFDRVFVDIGVVNHEGRQIAYAGPHNLSSAMYSEADWFKMAITRPYFISDVFHGLRGAPHFIVAVRHAQDDKPWLLRATIDFTKFNNLVENVRTGETGFAFILNKQGQFQTKPVSKVDPERFAIYFTEIISLDRQSSILRQADNSGKQVLNAFTTLKNGEWMMVVQQDFDDAFSDLKNAQKIAFLIILIGSLGIIASALFLSRRLIHRITEADEERQIADDEKEIMSQQVIETGKLASVGELASGIAHEINNPVAIMVEEAGWIQDLLEEEELKESENLKEIDRAFKQIHTQGRRCKDITHKLLSFARKTDSRLGNITVNELLNEMIYLSSQRAKYGNIEISTQFEKELPPISASETELQQVFLNLINNAIDAMEKTGGSIILTSKQEGDNLLVAVADSGPGIAHAHLARLFDPFFTTKPVGKGTGLGLSICYGIIEKMGGKIDVQSEIGKGTTFEIRIPINSKIQALKEVSGKDK